MRRRALLAGLAGGTALVAGCSERGSREDPPSPSGDATTRPLDEPLIQHGLTSEQGQYTFARLFRPGDSLPVVDDPDAAWLSEAVEDLDNDQSAILTNLRAAGTAPAYFWPSDAGWTDDRLRIELERRATKTDSDADEVVGVALATFDSGGSPPESADIVCPGGAIFSVGIRE